MSLRGALGFYDARVRTPQGSTSKTFKAPAIDTTLTIPELFQYHAENSPEHPVFVYVDDGKQEHYICFPEVYHAIRKAATLSSSHLRALTDAFEAAYAEDADPDYPVVGILANTGTRGPPSFFIIR